MENASETVFKKTSDEFLIQQFMDGNENAFDELYHRYLAKNACLKRILIMLSVLLLRVHG